MTICSVHEVFIDDSTKIPPGGPGRLPWRLPDAAIEAADIEEPALRT